MTPTDLFVQQLEELGKIFEINEGELCLQAGAKSRSQISAARTRGNTLQWDFVAAVVTLLERRYSVRREWLLWGEGKPIATERGIIRIGETSDSVNPAPIRRKGLGQTERATDPTPRARKHGDRDQPRRAAKVHDR